MATARWSARARPTSSARGRSARPTASPFRVFTPFSRAWVRTGWAAPAEKPARLRWAHGLDSAGVPDDPPGAADLDLPEPGEEAARDRWEAFREGDLRLYPERRDRPDLDATSRLSGDLKYGALHPRTLLADLDGDDEAHLAFRTELCWRDFYADVLWHRPDSAREDYSDSLRGMRWDDGPEADARFDAWREGRTGYPVVDAAMRQLARQGWMHNRMRMVVASFLVKDLHLDWRLGARHFMQALHDGDLASNNHGWQWTAGTGTDAAPFFRIFNPVLQGTRFDPDGEYVRRWVPELRGVAGTKAHMPWELAGGLPEGYPERVVDHGAERDEALARYREARDR